MTILGAIFSFGRAYLFAFAGEQVVAKIRCRLFRSLVSQDVAFFDGSRTGELISRLSADTVILKDAVTSDLSMWCVGVVAAVKREIGASAIPVGTCPRKIRVALCSSVLAATVAPVVAKGHQCIVWCVWYSSADVARAGCCVRLLRVRHAATALGGFLYLFVLSWKLALMVTVLIPVSSIGTKYGNGVTTVVTNT